MTLGREHRQNVGHRLVTARSVFVAKLRLKLGRFGDYLFPVPATKYLILLVGVRGFEPPAPASRRPQTSGVGDWNYENFSVQSRSRVKYVSPSSDFAKPQGYTVAKEPASSSVMRDLIACPVR